MIDPQPGHLSFPDEPEQQSVALGENRRVFHSDGAQVVDIEKPPVIDLLRRHRPVREPVHLPAQEFVQQVEAPRVPSDTVEDPDILIDECPD